MGGFVFAVDGVNQFYRASAGMWSSYSMEIPAGTHTISFANQKGSKYTDFYTWVDDVVWIQNGVKPDPVINLTVPELSPDGSVALSWDAIVGSQGYVVERATNAEFTTGLTQVGSTTTTTLTDTVPYGTYYYRVQNLSDNGLGSDWTISTPVRVSPVSANISGAVGEPGLFWDTASCWNSKTDRYMSSPSSAGCAYTSTGTATYPMRATVEGPGIFQFNWQTNTGGVFVFSVDGVTEISGVSSGAWSTHSVEIPAGTHALYFANHKTSKYGDFYTWFDNVLWLQGATKPAAVTNLMVPSTSNDGSVPLSWDAVSGTQGYVVERATNADFTAGLTRIDTITTTSITDTVPYGTYYYRVQNLAASGLGSNWTVSNAVQVNPLSAGMDDAVGGAGIFWDAASCWNVKTDRFTSPSSSIGCAYTSTGTSTYPMTATVEGPGTFQFQWQSSGGGVFDFAIDGVTQFSSSSNGVWLTQTVQLDAGTHTLYFANRKTSKYGDLFTWIDDAIMVDGLPPSPVTNLIAPEQSPNGEVSLSWDAVDGAANYIVERATSTDFLTNNVVVGSPTTTSIQDVSIPFGTYYYRVKSVSAEGLESDWVSSEKVLVNPLSTYIDFALGNPELFWYSSAWNVRTDNARTGGSSVGFSHTATDTTPVPIETYVEGPGVLQLKWQTSVSSSAIFDVLLDGAAVSTSRSLNATTWENTAVVVPAGLHTVAFSARKSNKYADFNFWVDDVLWVPGGSVPNAPTSMTYPSQYVQGDLALTWEDPDNASYYVVEGASAADFSAGNVDVGEVSEKVAYTLPANNGYVWYRVAAVNTDDIMSGWTYGQGMYVNPSSYAIDNAVEQPGLFWETTTWHVTDTEASVGSESVYVSNVNRYDVFSYSMFVDLNGSGVLQFDLKGLMSGGSNGKVYVDGVETLSISDNTEWTSHVIELAEGDHRVEFRGNKIKHGYITGFYVDNVVWSPDAGALPEVEWLFVPSVNNTGFVEATWPEVPEAEAYSLEVSTSSNFNTYSEIYYGSGLTTTTPKLDEGEYFFRIKTKAPGQIPSAYVEAFSSCTVDYSIEDSEIPEEVVGEDNGLPYIPVKFGGRGMLGKHIYIEIETF